MQNVLIYGVKNGEDGNLDNELLPVKIDSSGAVVVSGSASTASVLVPTAKVAINQSLLATITLTDNGFSVNNDATDDATTLLVKLDGSELVNIPKGALYETPVGVKYSGMLTINAIYTTPGGYCYFAKW